MLCGEALDLMTGSSYAATHRDAYATAYGALLYQVRVFNVRDALMAAGGVVLASPMRVGMGDFILGLEKGFWCGHVSLGEACVSARVGEAVSFANTMAVCCAGDVRVVRVG